MLGLPRSNRGRFEGRSPNGGLSFEGRSPVGEWVSMGRCTTVGRSAGREYVSIWVTRCIVASKNQSAKVGFTPVLLDKDSVSGIRVGENDPSRELGEYGGPELLEALSLPSKKSGHDVSC